MRGRSFAPARHRTACIRRRRVHRSSPHPASPTPISPIYARRATDVSAIPSSAAQRSSTHSKLSRPRSFGFVAERSKMSQDSGAKGQAAGEKEAAEPKRQTPRLNERILSSLSRRSVAAHPWHDLEIGESLLHFVSDPSVRPEPFGWLPTRNAC